VTPSSTFYEPQRNRAPGGPGIAYLLVQVTTDEGITGVGSVGAANGHARYTIENHLKYVVLNQSPFDVEVLWERMYRESINYGRKGMAIEAISAIDIALWDIMGKATGQPVYNLLGGRTRERIRAYASRLYATEDLDALAADAYMGWDVRYAIRMIRMLEDAGMNLAWVEEPVLPDDIDGYAQIAAECDTLISGGEHEFTRYGFRELIGRRAVDIVQIDVNRAGGITEARKVWALAAAHDLPVLPHAGQMHNYHLIMAHMNSPIAEFFPPPTGFPDGNELFWTAFVGEPLPQGGYVTLPDRPGLGLELNQETIAAARIAGSIA
jgi:L-alanine-DL-glutamate epimerase-like enolase superfamily enzyme